MVATIVVDLDHLFSFPFVFVLDRCSIGFHPLHSYYAIGAYFFLVTMVPKIRVIAVGLIFHMITDLFDCLWIKCINN